MSIIFLQDSHVPHVTKDVNDLRTSYIMTKNDFFNGFGVLLASDGVTVLNNNFRLPTIGDKYIVYHFLGSLAGTLWEDLVLNDITLDLKTSRDTSVIDNNFFGIDNHIVIVYTWSNGGEKDSITPNDQSSMEFEIETNTELVTTDLIIDTAGTQSLASHEYFTTKNPTVFFYSTNDDGDPTATDKGKYNTLDEEWQRYHRDNNESPSHEVYTTKTILTVTTYSKRNYNFLLSDNLNKINNTDFIVQNYNRRDQRLLDKGKQPTSQFTDIATVDDSYRWLFFDFNKSEHAIDIYKYDLFFLYKPDKWTTWFDSTVDEYEQINMYETLLAPQFNTGI